VCLSSVALKAFSRIIEARLRKAIEGELEEEQAAFRPVDKHKIPFNKSVLY
jgi:hypothetical protein